MSFTSAVSILGLALGAIVLTPPPSLAEPGPIAAGIQGDVGIGGSARIDTATRTVRVGASTGQTLAPGGVGDLASLAAGELVTFASFGYGSAFTPLTIWSSASDGFSFYLQSLSGDLDPRANFLAVQGAGVLRKAGRADTPAAFTFSANIAGGTAEWRFSADTALVPVPAALPLFMAALAGLGLVGRRRT